MFSFFRRVKRPHIEVELILPLDSFDPLREFERADKAARAARDYADSLHASMLLDAYIAKL